MEVNLNNIIEKIKEEGVQEAEKKADRIIKETEEKAKAMLNQAEADKEAVLKQAKLDAEKLKKHAEEAARQAARDILLALREDILLLSQKLVKETLAKELSSEVIKEMVIRIADKFDAAGEKDIELLLSEEDKTRLEAALISEFKKKAAHGITVKVSPSVEHGFRIGEKGKDSYYDFTDEAIAEAFKVFLNPKLAELLDEGTKDL